MATEPTNSPEQNKPPVAPLENAPEGAPKPSEVVAPQAPAPEPGKAVVVDNSAPADNNIEERKEGDRPAPQAGQQPGDPSVKTQTEDGVVTERDATDEDLAGVTAPVENENEDEILPANGEDSGQKKADDAPEVVKMKNPSGKVVDVLESDVTKRHLFAAGFKFVDGEEYSDELKNEHQAYKARLKAQGIVDGVDQGDPGQSNSKGDIARRQGTRTAGDVAAKSEVKPKTVTKPSTAKPAGQSAKKGRAAKALKK